MKRVNFYHAIWMEENVERIFSIYEEIRRNVERYGFEEHFQRSCATYFYGGGIPYIAVGLSKDNIFVSRVEGHSDVIFNPSFMENHTLYSEARNKAFSELKDVLLEHEPDIFIESEYSCIAGCRECCDRDPESFLTRRYCEYFVEGYCSLMLAGDPVDDTCRYYYCSSFRESYVDAFSGPHGLRPILTRTYAFSKEAKEVLKALLDEHERAEVKKIIEHYPRYREVVFFNSIADEYGDVNDEHPLYEKWRNMYDSRRAREEKCALEDKPCDNCGHAQSFLISLKKVK